MPVVADGLEERCSDSSNGRRSGAAAQTETLLQHDEERDGRERVTGVDRYGYSTASGERRKEIEPFTQDLLTNPESVTAGRDPIRRVILRRARRRFPGKETARERKKHRWYIR